MAFKLFDLFKRPSPPSTPEAPAVQSQPAQPAAAGGPSPQEATSGLAQELAKAAQALQSRDFEGAIRLYDVVIARQSDHAEAHYKRANALNNLGRWEAALAGYDRAVELKPDYANAYCNRGTVLERLRRWEEALASYDRTIALNPGDYFAYYNRGSVLKELLRLDEALVSYEQAIHLKKDYAEAYINRGHVLQELRRHQPALDSYDKGIALNPGYAEAHLARANSLVDLERHEAAIASLDRSVELKPDYVEALVARGNALFFLKRHADAAVSFSRALQIDPERKHVLGQRRAAQMYTCDWSGLAEDLEHIARGVRADRDVCVPFTMLSLFDSLELHRRVAEKWVKEECPPDRSLGNIVGRARGAKIKVGYFSPDFRAHPVSFLAAELFETHDRSRFEITAFAFGPAANDFMRQRLERAFDRFIDVRDRTDREVATLAREMGIDIAVDLVGFTDHSRPKIFAARAAPIQLSYIGYLGTLGAPYMDYLLADETLIPPQRAGEYSEKIIWLPSYQVNDSKRRIGERRFSRAELGLPETGFVFCCFNGNYKMMPDTFAAWMRILRRVPQSCLVLYVDNPAAGANLRAAARAAGIDPARIVFGQRVSIEDNLARYRAMDLFLDTWPYNAGTTASDALWAGLPVLTRLGESFPARYAASVLNAIGLPELVAQSTAEYEELAVQLASDPARMSALRDKLAKNRDSTPLFDTPRFTRNLESAYERIYERYHQGLAPEHVSLTETPSP